MMLGSLQFGEMQVLQCRLPDEVLRRLTKNLDRSKQCSEGGGALLWEEEHTGSQQGGTSAGWLWHIHSYIVIALARCRKRMDERITHLAGERKSGMMGC